MVSLVIVSHSAKLAEGVAELARGMAGSDVSIAATGGMSPTDTSERPLGTDASAIAEAIQKVYSDDGVVVLMDLGSAILSTEMALEAFTPAQRAQIALTPAPLVEGAIAAAVQARLGSPLNQVLEEARGALAPKTSHLEPAPSTPYGTNAVSFPQPPAYGTNAVSFPPPTHELYLTVRNRLGLHARPAARFVQTVARYDADVRVRDVTTGRGPVNAKSINAVATLGVLRDHTLQIMAEGPQAHAALDALRELAAQNFGDVAELEPARAVPSGAALPTPAEQENELSGLAASPGVAIGAARVYRPATPPIPQHTIDDPARGWQTLLQALDAAHQELDAARRTLEERGDRAGAAIFEAQQLMLDDAALRDPARRAIFENQLNAAAALHNAATQVAAQYDALDDEYLRARGQDVRAVARVVLLKLLGKAATGPVLTAPGILVASDLTPAETAALDSTQVLGICTAFGAPTGHSAILARNLGIPAVVGLGARLSSLKDGNALIVDGDAGRVYVNPDPELIAEYTRRLEQAARAADAARRARAEPAITRDGRRIEVAANIGSAADARRAVEAGAQAVGLFRTEFVFLDRRTAPTEEEQYTVYRAAAEALAGRSLLIRTLDVGGDKPLPYINMPSEANPFLGWRGVRFCLAQPELFKTQLRAIVRVAAEFPARLMFPMIAALDEWRAAVELLHQARREVQARGQAAPERIEVGIMVEVPSAALNADAFARQVDFFSIGTNDLTQYVLAAERGNPHVASLADAFHPAILRLIHAVVQAAHAHGKWVGVCGEMAGDALAIPLLVGLGVDELSMNPPAIPRAKEIIRALEYSHAQEHARHALEAETAEQVRQIVF